MADLSYNEIELLEASIRGNTTAFESIVKKYQSFVCAITYSAIADVEKSEDMAQETFLHAWNNLSQLKDLQKFRSWLITITRNIISDSLRKQKYDLINKAAPIDQVEEKQISKIEPVQNALTKEQQAVVQNALMEIPEKYRMPLVLFYRHEKSVKNIAEQLELSEELVKQHLSRGRKMLREQVAAMVENSISKTGPTKAFTSIVMASIAGLAIKGTGAAAAAAGSSAVISSITAKIITAAAVIAVSIGTVTTYKHFTQPDESIQTPNVTASDNNTETANNSDNISQPVNMNIEAASIKESSTPEIATAAYTRENIPENNDNTSNTPAIALKNKPVNSPYEYFLFTRFNRESSTNTLVLARITDNGIELQEIITEPESNYHWREPICITGGKLYGTSYYTLYSIDLFTRETEQLSIRSSSSLDYNFKFSDTTLFAGNCLYGLSKTGGTAILRQLDFERNAYRDIANVSKLQPNRDMAISPDHKRLAYFALDTNGNYPYGEDGGFFLTIVDVESGKITQPAEPIKFVIPVIASSFPGIPIIWLDSENVAFVRSEIPEGENEFSTTRSGVNMLSMVNINTSKMEDITPLPDNPYVQFAPGLIQDNAGIGPLVQPMPDYKDNYRLDLKNRRLVENDLIAGDYRYAFKHLYYKEQDLGSAKSRYYKVSPDGKRIIWMSNETTNMDFADLYYYDPEQEKPVAVARVLNSTGLWLKAEDLKERLPKTNSGTKWTPLKDLSKNMPVQTFTDTRNNIRDYLTCVIKTDKNTYQRHEPVQVTLTLTNNSRININIVKPMVYGTTRNYMSGVRLNYSNSHLFLDSIDSVEEEISLEAGRSVSVTDIVEVNSVGEYSFEYRYEPGVLGSYRGSVIPEPLVFRVVENENEDQQKRLIEAKFARLMDKFHREIERDPNWFGSNDTVGSEIIGMPGIGAKLAPYLVKVIENETHKNSRRNLFRALSSTAGPEYLPFFKERLINGEDDTEQICSWMLDTYRESSSNETIRQQTIDSLILGMSNENAEDRRIVCSCLTKIYDKNIEICFRKAVEDENENIKLDAGFYLAAAKWLELAEWLKLASNEPDYAQYISACTVVKKLEQQFNITKGNLPTLSKEDFEATQDSKQNYKKIIGDWLSWAQENPRASFLFFEDYRQRWWENDPLRQE